VRLARHHQGDLLRNIAGAVLPLIMQACVDGLIGAGRPERNRYVQRRKLT